MSSGCAYRFDELALVLTKEFEVIENIIVYDYLLLFDILVNYPVCDLQIFTKYVLTQKFF